MHASNKSRRGLRTNRPGQFKSRLRLDDAIKPVFEQLERRQLLTTYFVNDNWVVTTDQGAPGLDAGDTVANTGAGDNGLVTGKIFGTDAFSTIADGITAASATDTIRVISGTYTSAVTVNKSVTLAGDNAGTLGTGVRVTESILNSPNGALNITAANVVVDGFTVTGASVGAGTGITVGAVAGVQVKNNIITANSVGVEFGTGSSNFTVDRNKIDANNNAGANRGQGVRVLANTVAGTITNNTFTGHGAFSSTGSISLVGSTNVAIGIAANGNTFGTNSVDIRTYAGTTGTTIVANTFAATSTTYINHAGLNEVNAGNNSFDGVTPAGNNNVAQQNAIVNKIIDGVDVAGRGLVRINTGHVYETLASFNTGLGTTTPNLQRAVDVATAGNIIHIEAGGTYTGSVSTAAVAVTLSPGASPGLVTIDGSLTLDSNDTLFMEINGLTPGTQHDQISVINGGVTLGSASLVTTGSTIAAVAGNTVTLILNDMADAVAGSFAGALNGGNVTVNGQPFVIFYNGGTGNDVVLVRVPAAAPPAVVWVDDNWTGSINGTDPDAAGPGTAFGFDEFDNIQSAIDAVASGGTIHVAAGAYAQNVVVDKAVSLLGPKAGIAGSNPGRNIPANEAAVTVENSDPDPNSPTAAVVFYITANNVSIDGFTVDGDNTSIVSGVVKNLADIDAVDGIASYEGVGGITVTNNIVKNLSFTGINFDNFYNGGNATSGNTISNNLVANIGVDASTDGATGISIADDFYAAVTGNVIDDVVIGIQTGNFNDANPGITGSISNNTVTASRIGIWVNAHYSNASTIAVSGNSVSAMDDAAAFTFWDGVLISSIENAVNVTFTNNTINGSGTTKDSVGYNVWNTPTSADLTVSGGTVSGVNTGVFVNNFDSFNSDAGNTKIKISGVDITAAGTGVWVYDSASNGNGATVSAVVTGGTEVQTASLGLGVEVTGSDATATIGTSDIHDNALGVSVDGAAVATISGNQIHDNDTGVFLDSGTTGSLIQENLFSANGLEDVYISASATGTSVKIFGNSLESATGVTNDSAATIQASGNWWGTTSNPSSHIAGSNAAGVDYSPWIMDNLDFDLDPTNGYQGFYDILGVSAASTQSTYLSAAATPIAEGIALLEDGGTLHILGGTYVENVSTAGKSVSVEVGASPAQVTITGSLTLDSNDILIIEAVGTNPATQYDNVIVSGTATLGSATLLTTIGYVPGPSDVLTVIDAATLTGTFAGKPQGASVGSNFRIDYNTVPGKLRFVQNTPFVVAEANGPYGINEGDSVTLSSAGSFDPDAFLGDTITNWDWDLNNDNVYGDVTGPSPTVSWATLQSFGINDGTANYTIKLRVKNNQNEIGIDTATITVTNVDPTISVTGAASSNEGSTYSLTLGPVTDPGADTISSYRVNWGDGSPASTYTPAQVLLASGVVTHVYVDDDPTGTSSDSKTISVDLQDEDSSPTYYTSVTSKTITVNNVNPAPTIVGAPAEALVNVPITVTGAPNDPGAADTFTYAWTVVKSGFGTFATQNSASATFSFTPDTEATYTISLTVTDDDTGVGVATNQQVVAFQSFKITSFTSNNSGFDVTVNRAVKLSVLNLYDGPDVAVDAADVTVIGALNPGTPIKGSLIWDAATNTAHWVATGGVLPADTYTVTLFSGAARWTANTGPNPDLDGNADGTGGDNYTNGFVIAPAATRVVSVQDFARGPSQNVVLPLGNTAGAGLPVRIDNAQNVTAVDFSIIYNPNMLNITAVAKAAGVPGDWGIASNVGAPTVLSATEWQINVTIFSGGSILSASAVAANLVQFTANVPSGAGYGVSEVVRIENVDVAVSFASSGGRGDRAVHKVIYIGDADGDTIYTGSDSGLIGGVVVNPGSGFDIYDLTDPRIIADVDGNGTIGGNDASFVAQKSVFAPRPEIPDRPVGTPPVAAGFDPHIDGIDNVLANPGGTAVVGMQITDSSTGLVGFSFDVSYDQSKLSLASGLGSIDVTLGSLFNDGTWVLVSNVDQANGVAHLSFYRSDGSAFGGGTGTFVDLHLHVSGAAPAGNVAVTPSGFANQGAFSFLYDQGSVQITNADFTGPALPVMSFNYNNGFPLNITATWAENVLGPKTLTLTNLTTASVVPVTLNYNPNTGTYTFPSFPNGVLPNGNYHGVINAASVTDGSANPMVGNATIDFFFLNGDANRDRVVNAYDLVILSTHWMQAGTFSDGDFNFDGIVNASDLAILSQNWQQTLAAPAAPLPAVSTSVATATARPAARTATRVSTPVINLVQ